MHKILSKCVQFSIFSAKCVRFPPRVLTHTNSELKTSLESTANRQSMNWPLYSNRVHISFTRVSKFRVSCIRVLAAIIVVYVFSCINKVFYFFVYVFSCTRTNKLFYFSVYVFSCINIYFYFSWYISCIFSCINVKAYFVLSAIYYSYIQSLKSQFRQKKFENKVVLLVLWTNHGRSYHCSKWDMGLTRFLIRWLACLTKID